MDQFRQQQDPQTAAKEREKQKQQEEMRQTMLTSIMDSTARERLSRISIVKPEKGKVVEDHLLRLAQSGQLPGKIDEKQLITLLERISDQEKRQETKITFKHRGGDDEDENWEENLFQD